MREFFYKGFFIFNKFELDLCLKEPACLLGDGTFSTTPPMFSQIYIIHLLLEKQAYPVFFILTKHKAKVVYDEIFNIIKNLGVRVRLFMSDYEKATRSSFRNVFEGITIKGCWFHYCQSLVKKVKDLKFGKEYTTNTEINELIRLFFSLAFVPPENINDYYDEIKIK